MNRWAKKVAFGVIALGMGVYALSNWGQAFTVWVWFGSVLPWSLAIKTTRRR